MFLIKQLITEIFCCVLLSTFNKTCKAQWTMKKHDLRQKGKTVVHISKQFQQISASGRQPKDGRHIQRIKDKHDIMIWEQAGGKISGNRWASRV